MNPGRIFALVRNAATSSDFACLGTHHGTPPSAMLQVPLMAAPTQRHYTLEVYLHVEEMSDVRHEFLDGQIFAMAGGPPEHAARSAAVVVVLGNKLRGSRCRTYSSDLRIRVLATGLATYADAAVICGAVERDPASPTHVTNPSVVVEVLSPKTEDYDRGQKREHYQQIPALQEYVMISHHQRRIEVQRRDSAGTWQHHAYGAGEAVVLPSIEVTFSTTELYQAAGVDL